nr:hypothetical protein [Gemmatimonadota bacterium]
AYDADPLLDLDQTPAFDPTEPEAIPDFDFDQTLGAFALSSREGRI